MPVYEYHCDKCAREQVPGVRRRIPSATSQRLHVSDIGEILIPNLGDVNPTGVEQPLGARGAFRREAQFSEGRDPTGKRDVTRCMQRQGESLLRGAVYLGGTLIHASRHVGAVG